MTARHKRYGTGKRRLAAAAIVTVVTPAAATLGAPRAMAADTDAPTGAGTYSGKALADGIRATLSVKDYLIIEDFVDGGGPTAQASLDSLGDSTAFSSLPYPGATAVAFPGLISTLSGKSVPTYPFYVSSQDPSVPTATVKQPGYLMHAESSPTKSASQTEAGAATTSGDEFGSFSTASVNFVDNTITSLGEARTRLALGAFSLNGAVSKAQIVRTPDGKIVKTSSFEADSIHLADLQIGVTDKGLIVGPQDAPLDPAHQVSDSITKSGVTVKFLPAVQTPDSVLSSGLEISTIQPIPDLGGAKGVISYIVGRSYAQADSAGFSSSVDTGGKPVEPQNTATPAVDTTAPAATAPIDTTAPAFTAAPDTSSAPVTTNAEPQVTQPQLRTVEMVSAAAEQRPLTRLSFYPLVAVLVPLLLLAALTARRFV